MKNLEVLLIISCPKTVKTACYLVDLRLINARFVSYNDQAPSPSCLHVPDVMHATLSPRPSPSVFAYYKWSKTWGRNGLGTRLHGSRKVAKNRDGLGTESRRTRTCICGSRVEIKHSVVFQSHYHVRSECNWKMQRNNFYPGLPHVCQLLYIMLASIGSRTWDTIGHLWTWYTKKLNSFVYCVFINIMLPVFFWCVCTVLW